MLGVKLINTPIDLHTNYGEDEGEEFDKLRMNIILEGKVIFFTMT